MTSMKKAMALVLIGVIGAAAHAAIWSAPATCAINGCEKEVSDGVQDGLHNLGRGIGNAVENHPEVAGAVTDSILAPVRWLVVAVMLVLTVAAAWFLWPWMLLVRNASAWAAIRRAAVMKEGEVVDITPLSICGPGTAFRSGFSRLELLFVIAVFLVLTIVGIWCFVSGWKNGADGADGYEKERIERRLNAMGRIWRQQEGRRMSSDICGYSFPSFM